MKFKIAIFVSAFALLSACGHKQNDHQHEEDASMEEHHQDSGAQVLELDSGKKWAVNPEMMAHIRNMEKDVSEFSGSTLPEYKVLAEKIMQHNALVVSSCTMKGKAHEQLHIWLLPFMDLSRKFAESGSKSEAPEYILKIKNSIDEFNRYFE